MSCGSYHTSHAIVPFVNSLNFLKFENKSQLFVKKKKKKYLARSVANQHCQGMTGDKIQNVIKCSCRKMNAGNYTQRSNLCGGVLRVSRRSEVSQREENEVGETDDVTVETHQIHLPWVKITQGQIGDGGIMNRRVPFRSVSTEAAHRQAPEPLVQQRFKDKE